MKIEIDEKRPGVIITTIIITFGHTGAEMEALTQVSIAALTIYDMIKSVKKSQ